MFLSNNICAFLQNGEYFPYMDTLENLVGLARSVPITLGETTHLQAQITAAHAWKEKTNRTFLKKSTRYSLMEVRSYISALYLFWVLWGDIMK